MSDTEGESEHLPRDTETGVKFKRNSRGLKLISLKSTGLWQLFQLPGGRRERNRKRVRSG